MDSWKQVNWLINYLESLNLEPSAIDIADLLWLALRRSADVGQKPDAKSRQLTSEIPVQSSGKKSPSTNRRDHLLSNNFQEETAGHTTGATPRLGDVPLHAEQYSQEKSQEHLPFSVPLPVALPDKLSLARSLRPLRRKVAMTQREELDEEASVTRIAETRVWSPVLRPQQMRWLDVALVVDTAPAMLIWQRTINEFQQLLERQGAFRDVRRWHLNTDQRETICLSPIGHSHGLSSRSPRELIDPHGRRLILVVSDCVAPAWGSGAAQRLLASLAMKNSIALVQVLPYRLWERTELGRHPEALIKARQSGLPNSKLLAFPVRRSFRTRVTGVPLPIAGLNEEAVAALAKLVAGVPYARLGGVILQTTVTNPNTIDELPNSSELLANFNLHASEEARQLMRALTVSPLSAPIMHLVHHHSVVEPKLEHMAEVLLSGLIRRDTASPGGDAVAYYFVEGAREALQQDLPRGQGLGILRRISEYIAHSSGQRNSFRAILEDPTNVNYADFRIMNPEFATIATEYLQRLGGRYEAIAQKIHANRDGSTPLVPQDTTQLHAFDSVSEIPLDVLPTDEDTKASDEDVIDTRHSDSKAQLVESNYQVPGENIRLRNPFASTGALSLNYPLFRGRTNELVHLEQGCLSGHGYFLIYGGRQNGKTTLLLRLEASLRSRSDEGVHVCRIDFQVLPRATSSDVFRYLARSVVRTLPGVLEPPEILDVQTLFDFLEDVLAADNVQRLVLLFDELGVLPHSTREDLAHLLRALTTSSLSKSVLAKVQFVLAGGIELYHLAEVETSSLHNVCEIIHLGDLSQTDAVTIITDGLGSVGVDEAVAVTIGNAVYSKVSGHPYFTQRLGALLAERQLAGDEIDEASVKALAQTLLDGGDPLVSHLQRSISEHQMRDAVRRLLHKPPRFSRLDHDMVRLELIGLAKQMDLQWVPRNPLLADVLSNLINTEPALAGLESINDTSDSVDQYHKRDVIVDRKTNPAERRTLVDSYLRRFAKTLKLTEQEKEAVLSEFANFRERAIRKSSKARIVDVALFGSISRDTAIRPLSDVDILVLYETGLQPDPVGIYRDLERVVREIYFGMEVIGALERRVPPKERLNERFPIRPRLSSIGASIVVNTGSMTLEILPCVMERRRADIIVVPDRNLLTWTRTNHLAHTSRTAELQSVTSGDYRRLVRLIKHWHRIQFPDSPILKGFVLECLVAQYVNPGIVSLSDNFSLIMHRILQERDSVARFQVVPELGTRGGAKRTNLIPDQFNLLRSNIRATVGLLEDTLQTTTVDEELRVWQKIFRHELFKEEAVSQNADAEIESDLQNDLESTILRFSDFRPKDIEANIRPILGTVSENSENLTSSQMAASPQPASESFTPVSQPRTPSLPKIGDVFVGRVLDGDEDVFLVMIPGFDDRRVVAILRREPDTPKYKVGKDNARVEVTAEPRISRSGRTVIEVRRAPKRSQNE